MLGLVGPWCLDQAMVGGFWGRFKIHFEFRLDPCQECTRTHDQLNMSEKPRKIWKEHFVDRIDSVSLCATLGVCTLFCLLCAQMLLGCACGFLMQVSLYCQRLAFLLLVPSLLESARARARF